MKKLVLLLMTLFICGCGSPLSDNAFLIKEKLPIEDCDCKYTIINRYGFTLSIFDYCDKWIDTDTLYSNQDGCTQYECVLHPDEKTFCFK